MVEWRAAVQSKRRRQKMRSDLKTDIENGKFKNEDNIASLIP